MGLRRIVHERYRVAINRSSAADFYPGLGARMHFQLGQDLLGVVAGSVGADIEGGSDGGVGFPFTEKSRDFRFPDR